MRKKRTKEMIEKRKRNKELIWGREKRKKERNR